MMRSDGFTLIEILIVVVILGILAAIVLPQLSNATDAAKAAMLADNLRLMRSQIMVFKGQHWGVSPGYPGLDPTQAPDPNVFTIHITTATNGYGPYMSQIPENPINGKTSVLMLGDADAIPAGPSNQYGWIYQPATLTFKADATGADDSGRNYFDY